MATELLTNTHGFLTSKHYKLAQDLLGSEGVLFPDIPTMRLLVYPVTSQTDKRFSHQLARFSKDKDPDLVKLSRLCEIYFAWGSQELIIKKYVSQFLYSFWEIANIVHPFPDSEISCGLALYAGQSVE